MPMKKVEPKSMVRQRTKAVKEMKSKEVKAHPKKAQHSSKANVTTDNELTESISFEFGTIHKKGVQRGLGIQIRVMLFKRMYRDI